MSFYQPVSINLFPDAVPEDLLFISQTLSKAGFEVFLVGGAVRDLVKAGGYNNSFKNDFDFTTNAHPEEVVKLFSRKRNASCFTVPTGIAHGTVTVVIKKGEDFINYEITTYRTDGQYTDGRHPDSVTFATKLTDDLSRRDFTVNAMAYDIEKQELHDPYGGLIDLEKKLIRTVGEPIERFREDGLRAVRACRFSAQLDFKIEEKTFQAIKNTLDIVVKVSTERVHDELLKLMKSEEPSIGIEALRETGILELFIPELMEGYKVEQNEYHRFDIYFHNIYSCDAGPKDKPLVRLAALFHDMGKARAKSFALSHGNGNVFYNHEVIGERLADRVLKRLKFSNHDAARIKKLVNLHMFYYTEEWTDGAVRRFLRKFDGDMDFLKDLFLLRKADRIGSGLRSGEAEILDRFKARIQQIIDADNALKVTDLDINGNEIMEHFKIKPSRIIGDMLEYMLDKVLDTPELNTKEELLKLGEEFMASGGKLPQKAEEEDMGILI